MKSKIKYVEIELAEPAGAVLTPEQVRAAMSPDDFDFATESIYCLVMDSKDRILKKLEVAKGSVNTVSTTPGDLFRRVLLMGSEKFIIVHNHPSGEVEPSEEDLRFTRKVWKGADLLGLKMLDHVIVNPDASRHYSFREAGIL